MSRLPLPPVPRTSRDRDRARVATHPSRSLRRVLPLGRRRLEADEWASGEALPSVGKLATEYPASRTTVGKALKVLEAEGLITIVTRWGTFRA